MLLGAFRKTQLRKLHIFKVYRLILLKKTFTPNLLLNGSLQEALQVKQKQVQNQVESTLECRALHKAYFEVLCNIAMEQKTDHEISVKSNECKQLQLLT